jgi:hypothetical protein
MNIRKIISESVDEFEWAKQINVPDVYAVYYGGIHENDLEGYFTEESFNRYLRERNIDRLELGEEPEEINDFTFEEININW